MKSDLEEAIEVLREAALKAEICYSNHILRVLLEFEPPRVALPTPVPEMVHLVEPSGPNQYVRHVVDPRRAFRFTFCGVDAGSWCDLGPSRQEGGRVVYGPVCHRCAHSLHLAVNGQDRAGGMRRASLTRD